MLFRKHYPSVVDIQLSSNNHSPVAKNEELKAPLINEESEYLCFESVFTHFFVPD